MTRQTHAHAHARQFGFLVLALVIALGLFMPQFARADDATVSPAYSFSTSARVTGGTSVYTAVGTPTLSPRTTTGTTEKKTDLSIYTLGSPTASSASSVFTRPDAVLVTGPYLEATRVTNLNIWTEYAPATRDLSGDCYSRTRGECVNAVTVNINFETREESTPIITLGLGAPVNGTFPIATPTVTLAATSQPTKYHQIVLYPANDAYRLFQPGPVTCTADDPPRCAPAASPNHWDAAYMLIRYDMPSHPNAAPLDFKLF